MRRQGGGHRVFWAGLSLALCLRGVAVGRAQEIQLGTEVPGGSAARRQHVELETQTAQVKAGKPDWVELRFRIDTGLHINSHTPHDELLVATTLEPAAT